MQTWLVSLSPEARTWQQFSGLLTACFRPERWAGELSCGSYGSEGLRLELACVW